jgi:hypothetical protein
MTLRFNRKVWDDIFGDKLDDFYTILRSLFVHTNVGKGDLELEEAINQVYSATFNIGTETVDDEITVGITLLGTNKAPIDFRACCDFYLSSDTAGQMPVAIPTSITVGTDGALVNVDSATSGKLITEATGECDLVITGDTGADTVYLNVILPNGKVVTSDAIVIEAD